MKLSTLEFPILAIALLMAALIVLNLFNAVDITFLLAFVPVLIWAVVLFVKGRQSL